MGKYKHSLLGYTEDQVHCAHCGWVRRVKDAQGRPKCSVAKKEQRGSGTMSSEAREAKRLRSAKWRADHPDHARNQHVKYRRSIAQEKKDGLRCGLCGVRGDLQVDHDHRHCPGKHGCPECIRGMLCNGCNQLMRRVDRYLG